MRKTTNPKTSAIPTKAEKRHISTTTETAPSFKPTIKGVIAPAADKLPSPARSTKPIAGASSRVTTRPRQVTNKLSTVIALLRERRGATIARLIDATGWQAHSVRGAISGAIKKKHGLKVESMRSADGRVYRIVK